MKNNRHIEKALNSLKNSPLKITKQRVDIIKILFKDGNDHFTAEDVHRKIEKLGLNISLATVYNCLNQFTDHNIIKSPMVGTIYLSPSPEEPTFISVGKKIKKGDTILIIEAMKTMNQIPSTLEGTVKEILVNNESPVEFDTPLVIIEP